MTSTHVLANSIYFIVHGGTADRSSASRVKWAVKKLHERVVFIDHLWWSEKESHRGNPHHSRRLANLVDKPHLGCRPLLTKKTTLELWKQPDHSGCCPENKTRLRKETVTCAGVFGSQTDKEPWNIENASKTPGIQKPETRLTSLEQDKIETGTQRMQRTTTNSTLCNWILRVEAEHSIRKQAETRRPGGQIRWDRRMRQGSHVPTCRTTQARNTSQ